MCFSLCMILLVYYFMHSYDPSTSFSLSYHSGFLIVFEFFICIALLLDIFSNIVINSIVLTHCEPAWGLCSDSYLLLRYALGNHRYCHHRTDINNKGIWNTHFNGNMRWVRRNPYVDMAANSAVSPDDQVYPSHNPLLYQILSHRTSLLVYFVYFRSTLPLLPLLLRFPSSLSFLPPFLSLFPPTNKQTNKQSKPFIIIIIIILLLQLLLEKTQ